MPRGIYKHYPHKVGYNKGKDNPMFGKKLAKQGRKKISLALQGENNGLWKGNKASYVAIHIYVKNHNLKPKTCLTCNKKIKVELHNLSGKYSREFSDWEWLCRRCHMIKDNRLFNLKQYSIN